MHSYKRGPKSALMYSNRKCRVVFFGIIGSPDAEMAGPVEAALRLSAAGSYRALRSDQIIRAILDSRCFSGRKYCCADSLGVRSSSGRKP